MSVIVKVPKETYVEELKNSLLPNKLYVLPKDIYESYVKKGYLLEYVDSLKMKVDENFFHLKDKKLKVLITAFQALGDGILLTPALRRLKEINKDLHITLEIQKDYNLLKDCPYVDEFVYSPLELDYIKSFDTVINIHMLVGSIMYDLNHMAYYYYKLFGIEEENPNLIPYVYVDKDYDNEIKNLFDQYRNIYKKPILGFHFAASSPHRIPHVDIFCNAISKIEKFFTIVYAYTPQYKFYADEVKNYLPKAIDISSYIKNIEYLPAYVKNLDYLISVDTVLPHIAAYTKTPTLTILGPGRFENVNDYKVPYIKGLEMNYKGTVCSSPCQIHKTTRCPEAIAKNTKLSPCFSNLNSVSLLDAFSELLNQINERELAKEIKNIVDIEKKSVKEILKRLSTIAFDMFSTSDLAFLGHSPILKQVFSYVFSKDYLLNKKIVLFVKGYESIASSLFINRISDSQPTIYVEDEFYRKLLKLFGIESKILDYSNLYIPENAVVIDICFSSFSKHNQKEHIENILKHIQKDTVFFSFFFNNKRLHKYISKGQDIFKPPFDAFIVESSEDISKEFNLALEKLPIHPIDYINVFGDYITSKEIQPHNQSYKLASLNRDYSYILCLTNTNYKSYIDEYTRFYSFYEKTFFKPDINIVLCGENPNTLFFSIKSPMNEYFKNHFKNTLFIEMLSISKNDKETIAKYIEKYSQINELWFYGDAYLDYLNDDENYTNLKSMLSEPKINIILGRNPFTSKTYLKILEEFMTKNQEINIYTLDKSVFDIMSKKHNSIKYFEIEYDNITPFENTPKNIDILILSESSILPIKNKDFVEKFFARYIQGFSKNLNKIVIDFVKEYTEKKDLFYFDEEFLSHYKEIIKYYAMLDSFLAQEIKQVVRKHTKNILYASILNFQDIEPIKDVAIGYMQNKRYLPDILFTDKQTYNNLIPKAKVIVYLKPISNFQEVPYFCLKAAKSNIPCITQYQKNLEGLKNVILAKNLTNLKEVVEFIARQLK